MNNPQPSWLTMPPAELAAVILPWFSSSPYGEEGFLTHRIARWLTTGSDRGGGSWQGSWPWKKPDIGAVLEAIQVLEHARLLMRSPGDQSYIGLTRLGMHALQTNTVRQHLGLGDNTPPTA